MAAAAAEMVSYAGKSPQEIELDISKDLEKAWNVVSRSAVKTLQVAKASAAWTAEQLMWLAQKLVEALQNIIAIFLSFIRYVAAAFGVKMKETEVGEDKSTESAQNTDGKSSLSELANRAETPSGDAIASALADDASALKNGVPAVSLAGDHDSVTQAHAVIRDGLDDVSKLVETVIHEYPSIKGMEGDGAVNFLQTSLSMISEQVDRLRSEHKEKLEAITPLIQAAALSLGTNNHDQVFEILSADESVVAGVSAYDRVMLKDGLKDVRDIEVQISKGLRAFALCAAQAKGDEKLWSVVESVTSKFHFPELSDQIEQISKSRKDVNSVGKSVAGDVNSRNNFLRLVSAQDAPEIAEKIVKANVDAGGPPPGVSRFGSIVGTSVGDFPDEEGIAHAEERRESNS